MNFTIENISIINELIQNKIVCTYIPTNIEVNINNETGIVINPDDPEKLADSIIKLYEQKELRLKLGKNARKRVEKKFNWTNNVNEMIKLYKSYN